MEFNSSYDQTNFMGYYPPSPISNGGWEYHHENTHSEHSNSWRFASETQDEQENHMGFLPPPQNDASCYSNDGWGEQNQKTFESPYSTYQELSSLERTINSLIQNFPNSPSTQISMNQGPSKLETMFERHEREVQRSWKEQENSFKNIEVLINQTLNEKEEVEEQNEDPLQKSRELLKRQEQFMKEQQQSWREQEIRLQKMDEQLENIGKCSEPLSKENKDRLMDVKDKVEEQDEEATASSELSMKNEVVENETALEVTKEPEHSQPPQTPLDQKVSTIESEIKRYEEEMKKCWEDQQTSSMKELLKQMLSVKEELEEQESEEIIPNSSEAEKYMKEKFMEPPVQKALDEYKTPIITQQPSLESKEVKAISKNTNPVPDPASKINQAICKRKLAEERPRQGTLAESSPPLRSFLLTNWKKRKKVKNNMSS
ncbi:hypothetical protein AHAS_Ahas15G0218600 [Arachis hypogaea]